MLAWLAAPVPALAQDNVVATAALPRDLSPWGMYLNADIVVKAVLMGLAFASVVTWTVWLAKTIELMTVKRRLRAYMSRLAKLRASQGCLGQAIEERSVVGCCIAAAVAELQVSGDAL